MSTDPQKTFICEKCKGAIKRSVGSISPSATLGLKVFAGDWFKKTYGYEIGADGEEKAERRKFNQALIEEHKRENEI